MQVDWLTAMWQQIFGPIRLRSAAVSENLTINCWLQLKFALQFKIKRVCALTTTFTMKKRSVRFDHFSNAMQNTQISRLQVAFQICFHLRQL